MSIFGLLCEATNTKTSWWKRHQSVVRCCNYNGPLMHVDACVCGSVHPWEPLWTAFTDPRLESSHRGLDLLSPIYARCLTLHQRQAHWRCTTNWTECRRSGGPILSGTIFWSLFFFDWIHLRCWKRTSLWTEFSMPSVRELVLSFFSWRSFQLRAKHAILNKAKCLPMDDVATFVVKSLCVRVKNCGHTWPFLGKDSNATHTESEDIQRLDIIDRALRSQARRSGHTQPRSTARAVG